MESTTLIKGKLNFLKLAFILMIISNIKRIETLVI
jgi:hypothetical protein